MKRKSFIMNKTVVEHDDLIGGIVMEKEKIIISETDVFGMYVSEDAKADLELQMCNCCQSCQAGKC